MYAFDFCSYGIPDGTRMVVLMLSWAVIISLCHAVMRLPGYLSWNVPFVMGRTAAPSQKESVHASMLCQHFKRRYDGTGICLFHTAVMPEAFLIPRIDLSVMRVLYQHPSWEYRDSFHRNAFLRSGGSGFPWHRVLPHTGSLFAGSQGCLPIAVANIPSLYR